MANWKAVLRIGDLHRAHEAKEIAPRQLAEAVAKRMRSMKRLMEDFEFEEIADSFEQEVDDANEYDDVLDRLYDFGDVGHRLWVDTFR